MNRKPCPIPSHRNSTTCCGRGELPERGRLAAPKWKHIGPGMRQYPDGHIERTPAAMARHKEKLLRRGDTCAACGEGFTNQFEVELSHRRSKGAGGWKRDDSDANLCLMHRDENREQGSRDLASYLADPNRIALRKQKGETQ